MTLTTIRNRAGTIVAVPLLVAIGLALAACSSSEPPETQVAAQSSAPSQVDQWAEQANAEVVTHVAEKAKPQACELITAIEMADILGQPVTATVGDQFTNQTICTYKSTDEQIVVNFQVDWGDADAAAMGMGRMGQSGPAAAESSGGLGDGYTQFGPTLMIRVGENLVTLQIMGIDDIHVAAQRMLHGARPRMG